LILEKFDFVKYHAWRIFYPKARVFSICCHAAQLFEYFSSIKIADEDENEFEKSIDYETEYIYETYYETDGDISVSANSADEFDNENEFEESIEYEYVTDSEADDEKISLNDSEKVQRKPDLNQIKDESEITESSDEGSEFSGYENSYYSCYYKYEDTPEHLFRNVSQELIQTSSKIEKTFQPSKTSQQLVDQEIIATADENDLSGLYRN